MKKLRHDLDFTKTYGSVTDSFDARVRASLSKIERDERTATVTTVRRRPYLRTAIIVAVLLALTATAVAAVYSRTGEFFLRHGAPGAMDIFQHDMEVGQIALGNASTQVGNVAFTLDDVLWGEDHIYATGTFRIAEGVEGYMLMDFGDEPHHRYAPFGTEREDATVTYAEYAEEKGLTLLNAEIFLNGVIDAQGELVLMETSFFAVPEAEGVFRYGLMVFPHAEDLASAREGGYVASFELTVYDYGEGSRFIPPDDDDPWGYWQPGSTISENWVIPLPPETEH